MKQKIKSKFCGKETPKRYQGYCQKCYKYFVMEHKVIYDLPPYKIGRAHV